MKESEKQLIADDEISKDAHEIKKSPSEKIKAEKRYKRREVAVAYTCLAPSLLLALVFILLPIIAVIILSFTDWDIVKGTSEFNGWSNYIYIFKDDKFIKSILNTLYFAAVKIPLDLVIALMLALMLDKKLRARGFFRGAYFMPVIVPMVAASMIWLVLYNPSVSPVNTFLEKIGLSTSDFLYDKRTAMPCIILFSLWKGLGYNMIILLAGLQSIPQTYIEAAQIDGALSSKIFFKIKLPLLSPIIYFVILMGFINSFKVFTQISVMTPKGGPLYSTGVMVFYIYQKAFGDFKMGRAAAGAVILFLLILTVTAVQKKMGSKRVHYS